MDRYKISKQVIIGALLLVGLAILVFVLVANFADTGNTNRDTTPDMQSQSADQVKDTTGSNNDTKTSPSGTDGAGNNMLRGE